MIFKRDLTLYSTSCPLVAASGEIQQILKSRIAALFADATISLSGSNISESTYLEISFEDEDGDYLETTNGQSYLKVRVSAHGDRHGSDVTLDLRPIAEWSNDDGDELIIDDDALEASIAAVLADVAAFAAELGR